MEGYRKSAHATYRCEYHFVWVPKYRYRVLLKDVKKRLNVYKKGTQVLKQLDIGWPFLKKRQMWKMCIRRERRFLFLKHP
jgi:REP element-mobilizing transposase RayT